MFFVPFLVNFIAKTYLVRPLVEYAWNTQQTEIFLNSYQQKRAFVELKNFEEKLYFESLIAPSSKSLWQVENFDLDTDAILAQTNPVDDSTLEETSNNQNTLITIEAIKGENLKRDVFEQRLQEKTMDLANRYNDQSIEAITNIFADFFSFLTLCYLLFALEIQINITKSFLFEVFFGLDDSKKSLLILLMTDLLVGYHSSNLWELFFEFLFNHYGFPESQTGIFLLVATLPVLLDVLFKYLIFRQLNRAAPATVATYRAMIE